MDDVKEVYESVFGLTSETTDYYGNAEIIFDLEQVAGASCDDHAGSYSITIHFKKPMTAPMTYRTNNPSVRNEVFDIINAKLRPRSASEIQKALAERVANFKFV